MDLKIIEIVPQKEEHYVTRDEHKLLNDFNISKLLLINHNNIMQVSFHNDGVDDKVNYFSYHNVDCCYVVLMDIMIVEDC